MCHFWWAGVLSCFRRWTLGDLNLCWGVASVILYMGMNMSAIDTSNFSNSSSYPNVYQISRSKSINIYYLHPEGILLMIETHIWYVELNISARSMVASLYYYFNSIESWKSLASICFWLRLQIEIRHTYEFIFIESGSVFSDWLLN